MGECTDQFLFLGNRARLREIVPEILTEPDCEFAPEIPSAVTSYRAPIKTSSICGFSSYRARYISHSTALGISGANSESGSVRISCTLKIELSCPETKIDPHSLLLVPEHKFRHRARARALAPEVVLGHRARAPGTSLNTGSPGSSL